MGITPIPEPTPFQHLQFRVSEAHWRWKVWKQLYLGDPSKPDELMQRHELMVSAAASFFAMLQNLLLDDVVLRICKLVDPEEGGPHKARRKNLSLRAAIAEASARLTPAALTEANALAHALDKLTEPFKTWRNWRGAHDDRLTAIGDEVLPPLPFADVDGSLNGAVKIMQLLDPLSPDNEHRYDWMIAPGDGEGLLYALRCARQYHKECIEQFRAPISSETSS